MSALTVGPATGESYWGTPLTDIQTGISVSGGKITGTSKYLSEGQLVTDWGAGNFLALKFTNLDSDATSVKVGLEPSAGSGLVEIIDDPDKEGVFKLDDDMDQQVVVVQSDGVFSLKQTYDLSELTREES